MADDLAQAGTGAPSDPQAPQGNAPTPPAPGAEPGTTISNPEAKKYADEAAAERRARKALEAKLAEYERAQQETELAKLGDVERLQKQHATLQEQHAALLVELQAGRLAREVAKLAPSLNLIDPDAAMLMLQAGGALEYDADGKPANVAKLLESLVAEKPYLVASNMRPMAPAPSSGGATNQGRAGVAAPTQAKPDPKALYQQRRGLANPNLWKK